MSGRSQKKSPVATVCTVLAGVSLLLGILLAVFGKRDVKTIAIAVICIIAGIALFILAHNVNESFKFKLWLKSVRNTHVNLTQLIQESTSSARKIYNMHPGKPMLKYIRKYNPAAADEIQGKNKKDKNK